MRRSRLFLLSVVWLLLMADALVLAPPARPDTIAWVLRLLTGSWTGEEPLVVALFNLMGVWPLACAVLVGWPGLKRWTLGPFVLGSMMLGAFVLIPGVVLTGLRGPLPASPWTPLRKACLGVLALTAAAIAVLGLVYGSPTGFVSEWRTDQFVHIMTLDFFAFASLSTVLITAPRGS